MGEEAANPVAEGRKCASTVLTRAVSKLTSASFWGRGGAAGG